MTRKKFKHFYRGLMYIAAICLKSFVRFLPRGFLFHVGSLCGIACFYLLKKERARSLKHLEIAFGNNKENYRITKGVFRNLGINLFEWLKLPGMTKEKMNRIVSVRGIDKIEKVVKKGKGIIVLTAHLGNWEYLAAYFGLNGYKGAVIARHIYFKPYDKLITDLREPVGVNTIWRDDSPRKFLSLLKRNELLGILPDQDTDKIEGIFVNFFNKPAYTPVGPVKISLASGADIVPCFMIRRGKGFELFIEDPIEFTITKDKNETVKINTEKWAKVVENYIRKYPEQWVWIHRRWETRCDG